MRGLGFNPGQIEFRRLARGPQGEAVVMQDQAGELRYIYDNGTQDEVSSVDTRNAIIEVAGCIAMESMTVLQPAQEFEQAA